MGSSGDRQKAWERAEHSWTVLILHRLEILEENSAAWEFFKLSLVCQLGVCFLHTVLSVNGEQGSLFSPILPSGCSSRCKVGSCSHMFPQPFFKHWYPHENTTYPWPCLCLAAFILYVMLTRTAEYPPVLDATNHFSSMPPTFSIVAWFVASLYVKKDCPFITVTLCWPSTHVFCFTSLWNICTGHCCWQIWVTV